MGRPSDDVMFCTLILLSLVQPATQPARTRAAIVTEFESLKIPEWDDTMRDTSREKEYSAQRKAVEDRWSALALELYDVAPNDPHTGDLLLKRWVHLRKTGRGDAAHAEIEAALAKRPPHALEVEIKFSRWFLKWPVEAPEDVLAAAESFIDAAGANDLRGADVLVLAADRFGSNDLERRKVLLKRAIREYPNAEYSRIAAGLIRRIEAKGKPFEFAFDDVATGRHVTSESLRGKIVVVEFWATWCGICMVDMPDVRKLHEKYQPQGVEFIGVSLDASTEKGGLRKLREAIERYRIDWPQYYQGDDGSHPFSRSWGVTGIPETFLIDRDGNFVKSIYIDHLEDELAKMVKPSDTPSTRPSPP